MRSVVSRVLSAVDAMTAGAVDAATSAVDAVTVAAVVSATTVVSTAAAPARLTASASSNDIRTAVDVHARVADDETDGDDDMLMRRA